MVNLFAQADTTPDQAIPAPPGAIAKEIQATNINQVPAGSYVNTMGGGESANKVSQGGTKPCLGKDGIERCSPATPGRATSSKGSSAPAAAASNPSPKNPNVEKPPKATK